MKSAAGFGESEWERCIRWILQKFTGQGSVFLCGASKTNLLRTRGKSPPQSFPPLQLHSELCANEPAFFLDKVYLCLLSLPNQANYKLTDCKTLRTGGFYFLC